MQGYRRQVYVQAGNARFWVVEKGQGPAVVFFHFGLGDWRVFEPQLDALADVFRCIAYDRRFFGRTEAPNEPYAPVDDAIALLDALDVERAALVGLSGGGGLALAIAYAHPERVTALVHRRAGDRPPVGPQPEARGRVHSSEDAVWASVLPTLPSQVSE